MPSKSKCPKPNDRDYRRARRQLGRIIEAGVPLKTLAHETSMSQSVLRNVYIKATFRPRARHYPSTINILFTEVYNDLVRKKKPRTRAVHHDTDDTTVINQEQVQIPAPFREQESAQRSLIEVHPVPNIDNTSGSVSTDAMMPSSCNDDHITILRNELYQHYQEKLIDRAVQYNERFKELESLATEERIEAHVHIYNVATNHCNEVAQRRLDKYHSIFMDLKTRYPDWQSPRIAQAEAVVNLFIGLLKNELLDKAEEKVQESIQYEHRSYSNRCDETSSMLTNKIASLAQELCDELGEICTREELLSYSDDLQAKFKALGESDASSAFDKSSITGQRYAAERKRRSMVQITFAFPELDRFLQRLKGGKGNLEIELSDEAVWSMMLPKTRPPKTRKKHRRGDENR